MSNSGRRVFKIFWRIATFVVALIVAAAGVGPNDAVSNIAKWLELVGLVQIPRWLYPAYVDTYVLWFSVPLFLLLVYPFAKREFVAIRDARIKKRAEELEKEAVELLQQNLKERARINRQTLGLPERPESGERPTPPRT